MPEDPKLTGTSLALYYGLKSAVYSQVLVVLGDDLGLFASRIVKGDEVFKQVHKIALIADAFKHGLHAHNTGVAFGEAFPLVEVFKFTGHGAQFGLGPVSQDYEGVMAEQMRDGVLVIGQVLLIGGLDILVDVLALDKKQRDSVYKADDVCAAAVEITAHPKLAHTEEIILFRLIKVKNTQGFGFMFAGGVAERYLNAGFKEVVFFPVIGEDALAEAGFGYLAHS